MLGGRTVQTFSSNPPLLHGVRKRRCLIRPDYFLDDMLDDDKFKTRQSPKQLQGIDVNQVNQHTGVSHDNALPG